MDSSPDTQITQPLRIEGLVALGARRQPEGVVYTSAVERCSTMTGMVADFRDARRHFAFTLCRWSASHLTEFCNTVFGDSRRSIRSMV